MVFHIKGMVSNSCKLLLRKALADHGFRCLEMELGRVEIEETLTAGEFELFKVSLADIGFSIIHHHSEVMIEKIKDIIIENIHTDHANKLNYSDLLSKRTGLDYIYLSHLFTEQTGTGIASYVIHQKVEYVKELLQDGEMNLKEIADRLHYSSVAHLCNQFKKVTGLTPKEYLKNGSQGRKNLEDI
jgi:YesN/AraC family two-component response regulator